MVGYGLSYEDAKDRDHWIPASPAVLPDKWPLKRCVRLP